MAPSKSLTKKTVTGKKSVSNTIKTKSKSSTSNQSTTATTKISRRGRPRGKVTPERLAELREKRAQRKKYNNYPKDLKIYLDDDIPFPFLGDDEPLPGTRRIITRACTSKLKNCYYRYIEPAAEEGRGPHGHEPLPWSTQYVDGTEGPIYWGDNDWSEYTWRGL